MGCTGSKSNSSKTYRQEADAYAQRKENGFKDPGLQQVMASAKRHKKQLRHVPDPDLQRKEKRAKLKANTTKQRAQQPHGTNSGDAGLTGGLTQDTLQRQRNKLKHVR
mmetsp:Transcript_9333/g.16983  ORF Transcript_9333/g.16983 Transcript_9333/m.16983 type:complete len:108 (+) Transcript_9333:94-417(+)